jgi:hypothetical protein
MLLGQPRAELGVARKAAGVFEVFLQCGQGGGRDPITAGGLRHVIAEPLLHTTRGIGLEPRRHTMAVDAQQGGQLLAVAGMPAYHQIQRL